MESNPFNNQKRKEGLGDKIESEEKNLEKNSEKVFKLLEKEGDLSKEKIELIKKRLGVFFGPFMIFSEKKLLKQQKSQQNVVMEYFKNDPSVEISSFYNHLDGSGELNIKEEIEKNDVDKNKIVFLLNGVVNPQDIIQGLSPVITKLFMAFLRLQLPNIIRYGIDVRKIIENNLISDYIINTTKKIQGEIFKNDPINVIVVRNASSVNLSDIIKHGKENTVLVVGGHGNFNSLMMTDKPVSSEEMVSPEKKLKAFVQHTCAMNKEQEEMGSRFAQKTFGWKRNTNPVDFMEDPLNPRSDFI